MGLKVIPNPWRSFLEVRTCPQTALSAVCRKNATFDPNPPLRSLMNACRPPTGGTNGGISGGTDGWDRCWIGRRSVLLPSSRAGNKIGDLKIPGTPLPVSCDLLACSCQYMRPQLDTQQGLTPHPHRLMHHLNPKRCFSNTMAHCCNSMEVTIDGARMAFKDGSMGRRVLHHFSIPLTLPDRH